MKFIAEIGINHNGNINIAKDLIKYASNCGCDIVKFQKRNPDVCVPEHQKQKIRQTPWGEMTYIEYKHKIEFGIKEYDEIDNWCKENDIDWTASAWDIDSQKFLQQYNLKYNKVASPILTNHELLNVIAEEQRYTFISTGMSTMEEIGEAVDIFRSSDCPFELMHSVSSYPMNNEDANLNVIKTLRRTFGCDVGYSGHEVGLQISIAAVALGATSIERHVTLDRSMWGSDQAASLGKPGLEKLVRDCKIVEKALGDGIKKVLPCEEEKRKSLRK